MKIPFKIEPEAIQGCINLVVAEKPDLITTETVMVPETHLDTPQTKQEAAWFWDLWQQQGQDHKVEKMPSGPGFLFTRYHPQQGTVLNVSSLEELQDFLADANARLKRTFSVGYSLYLYDDNGRLVIGYMRK